MKKYVLFAFLFFFVVQIISLADTSKQLTIELKDAILNNPVQNVHVYTDLYDYNSQETINTIFYVREKLVITLRPIFWEVKLKIDDISTKGKDYFYKMDVNLTSNQMITAYVNPVGSVRGNVYDKSGRAIVNAIIKFECSADYGELDQTYTDSFGSFSADWLPVGSCKVSALADNRIGYKNVEINKGEIQDIEVILEREVATDLKSIFIIVITILFIFLYLGFKMLKKSKKVKVKKRKKIKTVVKRMEDIMKTLNEKERKVIEFLLNENKEVTQSKIYYNTGISKASLSRTIFSLENKKIVETRRIGKLKKIKLSEWFSKG